MNANRQPIIFSATMIACLCGLIPNPAWAASRSYIGNGYDASNKIIYYDEDTSSGAGAAGYFPFGYYLEPSGANTGKLTCIRNIMGPAGFDITCSPSGAVGEVDKIGPMLASCLSSHVSFLAGTYSTTEQDAFLNRTSSADLQSMSGLLGWYHTDDANHGYPDFGSGTHGYPVSTVVQRNAYVKSKDLKHATAISLTGGATSEMKNVYAPTADFVGHQDYPMGGRTDNWDFWETFTKAGDMVKAASTAGSVPYSFTQSFTQGTYPKFPGTKDVDLQVYLCICAGTKGIYFYAYRDGMETSYPGFLEKTKQLRNEVKNGDFGKALLFGKRTGVKLNENANGNLFPKYYGIWEYAGSTFVVVINLDPVTARAISIPMPASTSGTMRSLFSYRTSNLVYNAGTRKIEGTLPTQAVEIYVVASTTGIEGEKARSGLRASIPQLKSRQAFSINGRLLSGRHDATLTSGKSASTSGMMIRTTQSSTATNAMLLSVTQKE